MATVLTGIEENRFSWGTTSHVTEAEFGVMWTQAREYVEPQRVGRSQEGAVIDSWQKYNLIDLLASYFLVQNCGRIHLCSVKHHTYRNLLWQPWGPNFVALSQVPHPSWGPSRKASFCYRSHVITPTSGPSGVDRGWTPG